MHQKYIAIAAWACLIFIIYATLSSADVRPELTKTEPALVVFVERFGAYSLLGVLFCWGYPRRLTLVCVLVLGSGEGWLTELSNEELKDLFTLRKEALGE